jgi:hypothetical protein
MLRLPTIKISRPIHEAGMADRLFFGGQLKMFIPKPGTANLPVAFRFKV